MPLDIARIRRERPQNQLHYFATVGSTMTEAALLANAGAPHGTMVIAEEQTKGLGRLGRSWHSEMEAGLYTSTLLRLPIAASALPVVTLVLGLATADAIQRTTHITCDLRWPNDVLIGDRKVAGILAHLLEGCVNAGIGINVNQTHFPIGLRTPATSLRIESSGRLQSRDLLLTALLESLDTFTSLLIEEGPSVVVRAFSAASSYVNHCRVRVEENGRTGLSSGLDENGFLLVRYDDGVTERVSSGGIRPSND